MEASSLSGALWAANWSTIAACLVLKVPQGSALLAAGSARGISLPSLLLEMAGSLKDPRALWVYIKYNPETAVCACTRTHMYFLSSEPHSA